MPPGTRESSFAAFVTEERPRLQGVAYLVYGDVRTAESVVDATLARLYDSWPLIGDAEDAVLRRLLDVRPGELDLPWQRRSRIELIDARPAAARTNGMVGDLAALQPGERQALVLERFGRLPISRIAGILDYSPTEVQRLARSARDQLIASNRARAGDAALEAELAEAIPYDLRTAYPAAIDIAHGKRLARQRVGRRLAVTAAAVVVLAALAVWAPRVPLGAEVSAPVPSAVQPTEPPPCEASDEICRIRVLSTWRSEMAEIVRSYVDPKRTYYAGYSYEAEPIYESRTFWQGRGGVLGLELSPARPGATIIYLQVATARDVAIPCGLLTKQRCVAQRFLSGNRFTLTETTDATEGVEVQYSPYGAEVVTIVARNTAPGRTLDVSRGDLIRLVQDSRLRLPHG
jgi:hypothetical protein